MIKTNLNNSIKYEINKEYAYKNLKGEEAFLAKINEFRINKGFSSVSLDYLGEKKGKYRKIQMHSFIFNIMPALNWTDFMVNANVPISPNIKVTKSKNRIK